jgi:hypothetical protein
MMPTMTPKSPRALPKICQRARPARPRPVTPRHLGARPPARPPATVFAESGGRQNAPPPARPSPRTVPPQRLLGVSCLHDRAH